MSLHRSALESFQCEVEPDRSTVCVRPVGELDVETAPLVEDRLGELWSVGFTRLVLDLRNVRVLDSAGLQLLLAWHAHGSADGIAFGVIPGPPPVQRVLEAAGVAERLTYWSGARS